MKRKMKMLVIVIGLAIAILFIKNVLAAYFNRIDPVGKLYWLESNDQYDPEWELMVCSVTNGFAGDILIKRNGEWQYLHVRSFSRRNHQRKRQDGNGFKNRADISQISG